jgi:3-deoxy-manno-octulosonate cytidylyltransferase (CMP-KDO synthetase)
MIFGIIPARYASSRFPGKPLVNLNGKSMIQRVYEQCKKCTDLDEVIVATDDQRIYDAVIEFGGKVEMTDQNHPSGTDRCLEVANRQENPEIIINIQGDEPLIDPAEISKLVQVLKNQKQADIATLIKKLPSEGLENANRVKAVVSKSGRALYFSRSLIPFGRDHNPEQKYYQHIGIYGYKMDALKTIAALEASNLEKTEGLEQLRWLENDLSIYTEESNFESLPIDTPEDVAGVLDRL